MWLWLKVKYGDEFSIDNSFVINLRNFLGVLVLDGIPWLMHSSLRYFFNNTQFHWTFLPNYRKHNREKHLSRTSRFDPVIIYLPIDYVLTFNLHITDVTIFFASEKKRKEFLGDSMVRYLATSKRILFKTLRHNITI